MNTGEFTGPAILDVFLVIGVQLLLAFLFLPLVKAAASGKLARNGFAGIRIPSTMASDEAWAAGHRAAIPALSVNVLLIGVLAAIAAVLVMLDQVGGAFAVAMSGFVVNLGMLVFSAVKANRAAKAVEVVA